MYLVLMPLLLDFSVSCTKTPNILSCRLFTQGDGYHKCKCDIILKDAKDLSEWIDEHED